MTAPATAARQYKGAGSITNTNNFGDLDNDNRQWTNWDSALDRADDNPGELVVFVTDGDPTALNLDQTHDAFNPPGTTVAFNTFRGDLAGPSVDRAVQEANAIKSGPGRARILAVGVGAAVTEEESVARLVRIAGPQVVQDTEGITSLNQVDVAVVPNFKDLADLLSSVVTELCSPSLAVRKFVQTPGSTQYVARRGGASPSRPRCRVAISAGSFRTLRLPRPRPG